MSSSFETIHASNWWINNEIEKLLKLELKLWLLEKKQLVELRHFGLVLELVFLEILICLVGLWIELVVIGAKGAHDLGPDFLIHLHSGADH